MNVIFFLVLTQEEWNEKLRAERKSEYSWNYEGGDRSTTVSGRRQSSPEQGDDDEDDDDDFVGPSLDMFMAPSVSNPNRQTTVTTKSFTKRPIHNELDDDDVHDVAAAKHSRQSYDDNDDELNSIPLPAETTRKGAEIEPPPTYEYYGPSDGSRGSRRVGEDLVGANEMRDSIAKGFQNVDGRNKPRRVRGIVDDDGDDDCD